MSYLFIFIIIYLIFRYVIPPFLAIFNFTKSVNNIKNKREIRSKINKMNIQDAEFDEK